MSQTVTYFAILDPEKSPGVANKIDQTLHMIDMGDYGYCKTCGIEIKLQRLEARPTADQCIDCKTISEKKEI